MSVAPLRRSILLTVVAVLGACTHASVPSANKALEVRATQFSEAVVRASASGWSATEVARLADFYTVETILFPPRGEPIKGREAVHRYWSRTPERKILRHVIHTERVDIDGDLAADHGTFTLTSQNGKDPPQDVTLRFVSIWKRGSDGAWRKQLDTWW